MSSIYKISKGKHFSNFHFSKLFPFTFSHKIEREIEFLTPPVYEDFQSPPQINKIYGFTLGLNKVHEDSVRIGFLYNREKHTIDYFAYIYENGMRITRKMNPNIFLKSVPMHKKVYSSIEITRNAYIFELDEVRFTFPRTKRNIPLIRFRLFPYFGGTIPSQNDLKISISKIYG